MHFALNATLLAHLPHADNTAQPIDQPAARMESFEKTNHAGPKIIHRGSLFVSLRKTGYLMPSLTGAQEMLIIKARSMRSIRVLIPLK